MSKSSGKSPKAIDRPFAASVLKQARQAVENYKVIIEQEDGDWVAHGLELPLCVGTGDTVEAAVAEARELMVTVVARMIEQGNPPPHAAKEGKRTEQVNIRLSSEEKLTLEAAAQASGFKGLGDFMRAASLEKSR